MPDWLPDDKVTLDVLVFMPLLGGKIIMTI